MYQRWKRSNKTVSHIGYHFIWCPKYRRPVLTGAVDKRLRQLLAEKAKEIGIEIETMEIMPDHVHLFISSTPCNAPQYIAGQLKGYTSHVLRREFAWLRSRIPTLWTRSYFVHSVGHISEDVIRKYIEDQKVV